VIVAERSSESNSPIDSLAALASEVRLRDAVFQFLVIALAVVVDQVSCVQYELRVQVNRLPLGMNSVRRSP
jgi:hypothetical protein